MGDTIVLYSSVYGSTQAYAEQIAEALDCRAVPIDSFKKSEFVNYTTVIYGGAVQAGEDSKVAVVREIREETGLDVSNCPDGYRFTYRRDNPDEGDNYFVDVYRFELDFNESDLKLQEEETMGYRLATLDEIKELDKQGIFLHYSSIQKVFE